MTSISSSISIFVPKLISGSIEDSAFLFFAQSMGIRFFWPPASHLSTYFIIKSVVLDEPEVPKSGPTTDRID